MISSMQKALIKKDIKAITSNKRLFPVLIIIPLVMAVVLPSIFILTMAFAPTDDADFGTLLTLIPGDVAQEDIKQLLIGLVMNNVIPMFFLLIPIMAASVMAASSFVGEKEKRTLETLLYSPLTLREIFTAKVLASFLLSIAVALLSFVAMLVVVEIEIFVAMGYLFIPDITWLILLILVAPAISIIAITIIVRGSAKAQTVEESQQRSVFLIIPIMLLAAGQFTGVLLLNAWMLLGVGVVFAVIAWILMRRSFAGFTYESLLSYE